MYDISKTQFIYLLGINEPDSPFEIEDYEDMYAEDIEKVGYIGLVKKFLDIANAFILEGEQKNEVINKGN